MRRWGLLVALLLSVGLNCGLVGMVVARRAARPDERPMPAGPGRGLYLEMAERLQLSPEQREQFFAQQKRFFEGTVADRKAMEEARRELRREVASPRPDRERVGALLDESMRRNAALDRAFVENVLATRDLLTPEQQRRFLAMLSRLRPGREAGMGPAPGRLPRDRWLRRQPGGRAGRPGAPPGAPSDGPPEGDGPEGEVPPPPQR